MSYRRRSRYGQRSIVAFFFCVSLRTLNVTARTTAGATGIAATRVQTELASVIVVAVERRKSFARRTVVEVATGQADAVTFARDTATRIAITVIVLAVIAARTAATAVVRRGESIAEKQIQQARVVTTAAAGTTIPVPEIVATATARTTVPVPETVTTATVITTTVRTGQEIAERAATIAVRITSIAHSISDPSCVFEAKPHSTIYVFTVLFRVSKGYYFRRDLSPKRDVVFDQQHRRRELRDQAFYLYARIYVDEIERFVPNVQMRLFAKTSRDRHFLFLTVRKLGYIFSELQFIKARFMQYRLEQTLVYPVRPRVFAERAFKFRRILRYVGQDQARTRRNRTRMLYPLSDEQFQKTALARTVPAVQKHPFATLDRERHGRVYFPSVVTYRHAVEIYQPFRSVNERRKL